MFCLDTHTSMCGIKITKICIIVGKESKVCFDKVITNNIEATLVLLFLTASYEKRLGD